MTVIVADVDQRAGRRHHRRRAGDRRRVRRPGGGRRPRCRQRGRAGREHVAARRRPRRSADRAPAPARRGGRGCSRSRRADPRRGRASAAPTPGRRPSTSSARPAGRRRHLPRRQHRVRAAEVLRRVQGHRPAGRQPATVLRGRRSTPASPPTASATPRASSPTCATQQLPACLDSRHLDPRRPRSPTPTESTLARDSRAPSTPLGRRHHLVVVAANRVPRRPRSPRAPTRRSSPCPTSTARAMTRPP